MRGIGQPIHKDTAYVVVSSPMEFAASWIALEDIQPNSGALEYYEGSHRGEEYLFDGKHKSMPEGYSEQRYLDSLHEQAREMGLARKQFFPPGRGPRGETRRYARNAPEPDTTAILDK